ncbi:MAG: class I SAM-dependent methyltransferase [Chloroflexota bacterium]
MRGRPARPASPTTTPTPAIHPVPSVQTSVLDRRRALVDLGCGRRPVAGAFGVDRVPLPGVDVVARLDGPHLPFTTGGLDGAFALNVLEHLDDLRAAMAEIHRVLRPGGRCTIEVPYFASVSAAADPTHRRWFTYTTFEHFAAPARGGWQANCHTWFSQAQFAITRRRLVFGRLHRAVGLSRLANRFPAVYENLFVYWLPARALVVELLKR